MTISFLVDNIEFVIPLFFFTSHKFTTHKFILSILPMEYAIL